MSDPALAAFFFLQLAVIVFVCRLVGWAAKYVGQPQAVAEMMAGFLIGPSFFGWAAPDWQATLFPAEAMRPLYICSQIGLVLFMFVVGLEFDTGLLTRHARRALSVSIAGVAAPFALGAGLAVVMHDSGEFFPASVQQAQAILFVGAALSITAFPVLARIIYERGIAGSPMGTLALAAGAMDDAAAWIILAIVLASFSGNTLQAIWPAVGGAAYLFLVFALARPALKRVAADAERRQSLEPWLFSLIIAMLMLGAWFTDVTGIYAVFGAFVLGVAMPRGILTRELQRAIAPITTGLLVPLYFVYSGLNTQLGLVDNAWLWTVFGLAFVAACAGKGLACWAAARATGATNRDAMGVATLMNARGLMELILLNIALQRELITPTTFTIFALIALATTLMAYPLFGLVCPQGPAGFVHEARDGVRSQQARSSLPGS
jgi:Kef-type K+ transport system membrane component KefB